MIAVLPFGSRRGTPIAPVCRHPIDGSILSLRADVNDDARVASAVSGAWAVVNAVSLYVERGEDTFQSLHVSTAQRVAKLARQAAVERLSISPVSARMRGPPLPDQPHLRRERLPQGHRLGFALSPPRHHIRETMNVPDLTNEDRTDLARFLREAIDADRWPLSPRVQRPRELLANQILKRTVQRA
jgi:hypothetical protein